METSPLTQDSRPTSFQPKIAHLYDKLLKEEEDATSSEGFWQEFFLLKPDRSRLEERLDSLSANDLLHLQHETQELFRRAVIVIKDGKRPLDEHAFDTLTVFLGVTLAKRYTNPSSDIITVIAGLDQVDAVFSDFANAIEHCVRSGRSLDIRQKAIGTALALTAGAYQTSLLSYFSYRDLFPALMKYMQDSEDPATISRAFLLLGLLANYNKFEFRNPYRARLEDFVNEATIQKIIGGLGHTCAMSRDRYVLIQEDVTEGWNLSSALTYIGLSVLAPTKPTPNPATMTDEVKEDFSDLPDPNAAVLLGAYDFTTANKFFCSNLVTHKEEAKTSELPFSAFLSLTSYILHHAHRSTRATVYGLLNLLTLRIIIEDLLLCKLLCDPDRLFSVRLCRQRQPFLPPTPKPRPGAAAILDILVDTINHNLRRSLNLQLYIPTISLVHRLLSYLTFTRTRLSYHWSLLWQTLLSFLQFLTKYAPSLAVQDPDLPYLVRPLLATLSLAVISGESFLPNPTAYDDLFYKLVEAGDYLERFKKAFASHMKPPSTNPPGPQSVPSATNGPSILPIDVLIQVSTHYHDLVEGEKGKGRMGNNMSPREVSKVIKQGYETLDLPGMEGLDRWDRFREGDERSLLKRAARVAVDDSKRLLKTS